VAKISAMRSAAYAALGVIAFSVGVVGFSSKYMEPAAVQLPTAGASWIDANSTEPDHGQFLRESSSLPDDTLYLNLTSGPNQQSITEEYEQWEQEHAALALDELEKRLDAAEQAQRRLEIADSYVQWEVAHAQLAQNELALRWEAAEAAQQEYEDAVAHLAEVSGSEQEAEAQTQVDEAQENLDNASRHLDQAKQHALVELRQVHRSQQSAVDSRQDELAAAQANALQLEQFPAKTMLAATDVIVRGAPSNSASKIGELKRGVEAIVDAQGNGYYRLESGGFISEKLVVDVIEETGPTQTRPDDSPKLYAWETFVANIDEQRAIDECLGGLTYSPNISKAIGKAYYPIHVQCQGLPILDLKMGDKVKISGVGVFKVVGEKDVNRGDGVKVARGLPGEALLQTCYQNSDRMRIVALTKVDN